MEGGVECGRASDAQNPTRCKSLYPTRKSNAVAVVRANPTRKSNAKIQREASWECITTQLCPWALRAISPRYTKSYQRLRV